MFSGSFVALITPFTKSGRIDVRTLQELVQWHVEMGTEGLVCTGSTGEAITLSEKDRKTVIRACVEAAEKKIPILAGTGTADTKQSIRLTESAQKFGVDGCLIIVPYYNKPTQLGCLCHFEELSRLGHPLVIYNNPGRCIVGLHPETIAEIAKFPNIVALKEANSDPAHFAKVRALTSLPIFAGEDSSTYEMLCEGAVGAISVIGNLLPRLWREMIHASKRDDEKKAKELFDRAQPVLRALSLETNPQGIKKALSLTGKCGATMRLPLLESAEEVTDELKKALIRLSLPFWATVSIPS